MTVLCQLCQLGKTALRSYWVADCSIELPMALTQTIFLFCNVPVAISRLLILSLQKSSPGSVLNRTQTKSETGLRQSLDFVRVLSVNQV